MKKKRFTFRTWLFEWNEMWNYSIFRNGEELYGSDYSYLHRKNAQKAAKKERAKLNTP